MDDISEIKQKLDIVQVIGEYVKLSKAGQNWKGLCPFHNEKTPSFMVNQDRQFFYCFGCNQGGDIFTFIQKFENVDFPEALKILANKAGIKLQKFHAATHNLKTRLLDLLDQAALYWQKELKSQIGKSALDYLQKRLVDEDSLQTFRLGYARDSWDNILNYLKKQGFTETEIFQAGLIIKKDNSNHYYDRFRDRLMFPIQDLYGNVIGFTGRTLKKDGSAKYINTPETSLYHKGKLLYALDKAKQEIKKQDSIIIVEGNMDALSSHRVGIKNVVAVSGTALTSEQITLIKRFTNNVYFCFDMDDAGQKAAVKSIDLALANDLNIKIIQIPFGKDPDECIRQNPNDWITAIKNAKSIMQFHFDKNFNQFDITDIEQKKQLTKVLLTQIVKLINPIERDYWLKNLANRLDVNIELLKETLPKSFSTTKKSLVKKIDVPTQQTTTNIPMEQLQINLIFSILINYPQYLKYAIANLSPEMFNNNNEKTLYNHLIFCYNKNVNLDKKFLSDYLFNQSELNKFENYLNSLYVLIDEKIPDNTPITIQRELITLINLVKKNFLTKQIKALEHLITKKEREKKIDEVNQLLKKLQKLIEQKNHFM